MSDDDLRANTPCPDCGTPLVECDDCFALGARRFKGLVCDECNTLRDHPEDSFLLFVTGTRHPIARNDFLDTLFDPLKKV